jgi:hypothetical protein
MISEYKLLSILFVFLVSFVVQYQTLRLGAFA